MSVQETTYYEKAGVKITNARAVMGTNTYPMTNITSVGIGEIPASSALPMVLILSGLGVMIFGFSNRDPGSSGWIAVVIAGVVVLGLGLMAARSAKASYFVKLGAAGGEQRAYVSADRVEIESIVAALNEAIVKRG